MVGSGWWVAWGLGGEAERDVDQLRPRRGEAPRAVVQTRHVRHVLRAVLGGEALAVLQGPPHHDVLSRTERVLGGVEPEFVGEVFARLAHPLEVGVALPAGV